MRGQGATVLRTTAGRRFRGSHHLPPLRLIPTACISLFVLAAAIASPIFAQAQATDLTPAAKLELGLRYKAAKDYAKAMPLFAEVAASQDSGKARAMFYIEDCYCEQGKIADAVAELTKAYSECPEARADVLLRRAARQCSIQKYKEGLADYEEFLANYPDKQDLVATISANLPEIRLRAAGLFDGPAAALEVEWTRAKNASDDPAYVKLAGFRLAECCLKERLWPKGAEVHAALIQDYPADAPQLKIGLGLCRKGQKQYDTAIQTFTDIAANDKSRAVEALLLRGRLPQRAAQGRRLRGAPDEDAGRSPGGPSGYPYAQGRKVRRCAEE